MNCIRYSSALLAILLILLLALTGGCAMADNNIYARDFGAIPNDTNSDSEALQIALNHVIRNGGGTLVLEPGRYLLNGPEAPCRMAISDCSDVTIEGNDAELLCSGLTSVFTVNNAKNITFRNLSIDWDPLPFTAGTVVATGDLNFDIEVIAPHEAQAGLKIGAVLGMDKERRRLAIHGLDLYQMDMQKTTELVKPGVMRCPVSHQGGMPKVGDFVLVRHQVYGIQAFNFNASENMRLENINVYSCPGMAIYAGDTTDVLLDRFRVTFRPGTDRWMTATADATHFNYCRGMIVMQDCLFEGMGDDATNIHNMQFVLSEIIDNNTAKIASGRKGWPIGGLRVGDKLEFCGGENRLAPYATLTIESLTVTPDLASATVNFTQEIPPNAVAGDVIGNSSALPAARITDTIVRRNRARGMLLQSRDIIIDRCKYEDISGAALHITCDADYWWEGMGTRDVVIRNSEFTRCNFGTARRAALIDMFGELGQGKIAGPGAHQRIEIYNNVIDDVAEGAAIHIGSAIDAEVRGNKIKGVPDVAVVIRQSRNVIVRDNIFEDTKGGIRIEDGVDMTTVIIENNTVK